MDTKKLGDLFFSFKGRINRAPFLWGSSALYALFLMLSTAIRAFEYSNQPSVYMLVLLPLLIPGLAVTLKRCHDRNHSGWFLLINLIPIIGPIWLGIELGLLRGTQGENSYGDDPLAAQPEEA